MITKTQKAVDHFRNGRIKEALKIAKTFRCGLTKEEQGAMTRAYECMVHGDFYKALGKDINQEIEKGITVFEDKIARGVLL